MLPSVCLGVISRMHRRIWKCVLLEHDVVLVLGVRNISVLAIQGSSGSRTWRYRDAMTFTAEKTSETEIIIDEHGKMRDDICRFRLTQTAYIV